MSEDNLAREDVMIKTLDEIVKAEKAMKDRFTKLAMEADTPEMRALFKEMALEEEKHEKELTERLTALKLMKDR